MYQSKKPKTRASGKPDESLNPQKREPSDQEDQPAEVTRCICGHDELQLNNIHNKSVDPDFFIQCDTCYVWQHGFCVGILNDEEAPEGYYCERCRPDYHVIVVRPSGKTSKYSPQDYSADENDDTHEPEKKEFPEDIKSSESTIPPSSTSTAPLANTTSAINSSPDHTSAVNHITTPTSPGQHSRKSHTPDPKESLSSAEARRERRRLTLNSRDAAYEETLRRVLEESVNDGVPSPTTPSKISSMLGDLTPTTSRKKSSQQQTDSQSGSDEPSHTRPRRHERTSSAKPTRSSKSSASSYTGNGSINTNLSKAASVSSSSSSIQQPSTRKRNLDAAGIASEEDVRTSSPVEKSSSRSRTSKPGGRSTSLSLSSRQAATATATQSAGTESNDNASVSGTASPSKRKRPRSRHATTNGGGTSTRAKSGLSESLSTGTNRSSATSAFGSVPSSSSASQYTSGMTYIDKPSKPRIPQARTSLFEMQKRVAAILEFIGRTRQDMDAEQADRKQLLALRMVRYKSLYPNAIESQQQANLPPPSNNTQTAFEDTPKIPTDTTNTPSTTSTIPKNNMSEDIKAGLEIPAEHLQDPKFDCLFEAYKPSFELMDMLTQKLVLWEQKFGCYGSSSGEV